MIRLSYVLFVPFQVNNRIMRWFQSIKLENARLTNNKRDIVRIIFVCGYIFRILIVNVAKFTDEEVTIFSRHYGKEYNGLELLNWWRLRPKSYIHLLTWPKTIDTSNHWATFSPNDWCLLNICSHEGYAPCQVPIDPLHIFAFLRPMFMVLFELFLLSEGI